MNIFNFILPRTDNNTLYNTLLNTSHIQPCIPFINSSFWNLLKHEVREGPRHEKTCHFS